MTNIQRLKQLKYLDSSKGVYFPQVITVVYYNHTHKTKSNFFLQMKGTSLILLNNYTSPWTEQTYST